MPDTLKQEIKLFYCYAREDKTLRDDLEKHLSGLKRLYSLRNWHDRVILPGEEWEQTIDSHLNTAHLILLLVSPDFMNSDYCYSKEMQRALERHEEGTCRVLPIILRPTYLESAPFSKLQMLPTDAKPITRWSDRDEAFHDVVKEISLVLKDLLVSLKTKRDWLDEGTSFYNLKRYDEALAAFEQALRFDPNYIEAHQKRGTTLNNLKRYDEALEAFEQAISLDPKGVPPYLAKGHALNALKRYDEAFTTFEQAIHLNPNLASAYIGRDEALQQLGISREAQEQLESQLREVHQQLDAQQKHSEQLGRQLREVHQQLDAQQKHSEQLGRQLAQTAIKIDEALSSETFNNLSNIVETICVERRDYKSLLEWQRIINVYKEELPRLREDIQKLREQTL